MSLSALKASLDAAIDDLLSIRSSSARQTAALASLETVIARFAVVVDSAPSSALLGTFSRWQDSPSRNVAATLLEWLGRNLVRRDLAATESGLLSDSFPTDAIRCLRLLQGLLLLHRPSQRFFARRSTHEIMLAILDLARPNNPGTPLLATPKPHPSPVLFPPTPAASPSLSGNPSEVDANTALCTQLSLAVLDVLLCGLVDRPKNMRVFEDVGGLAAIVRVLKDKTVAQSVRIKVLEVLFFYLMPETTTTSQATPNGFFTAPPPDASLDTASTSGTDKVLAHPENLPDILSGAADFIPQTPVKRRTRPTAPRSERAESQAGSSRERETSPLQTPRRASRSGGRTSDWVPDRTETATSIPDTRDQSRCESPTTPQRRANAKERAEGQPDDQMVSSSSVGKISSETPKVSSAHTRTPSASTSRAANTRPPHFEARSASSLDRASEVVRAEMPPPPRPSTIRHTSASRRAISQPLAQQEVDRPDTPTVAQRRHADATPPARARHTRSKEEKRELLRQVMPNVDALQERFKAMGLEL
ncbi:hypothetical protein JCM10908_002871 [Rhodotorula pacifica]|uniref:uncharacterized protein n=1 Tax=Rhodotorula pacifica TaxID=1495444 RepID=UPI0031747163